MAIPVLAAAGSLQPSYAAASLPRSSLLLMGTRIDIVVDPAGLLPAQKVNDAIAAAQHSMQQLAAMMNRYDRRSIVSRINAASGLQPVRVPNELMAVLRTAQALTVFTGGAFDATVGALTGWHFDGSTGQPPSSDVIRQQRAHVHAEGLTLDMTAGTAFLREPGMAIDLGGVAKLPILDAGLDVLRSHGIANALINGGGDVLVMGLLQGRAWRIGLRDPLHPEHLLGTVNLEHGGIVASSGDYERGYWYEGRRMHHVLDPRTGYPTMGVHGVAMVAARVADVNGLGAAAMVKGLPAAQAMFERRPAVHALVVGSDAVWSTPALRNMGARAARFRMQSGQLVIV